MSNKQYSDAAKRISWYVTIALLADRERAINSWMAFRLLDGWSNETLYHSKSAATYDLRNETLPFCFVKIPADGMGEREAEIFLTFNRNLYDNGLRMSDPDLGEREVIMPNRLELL